MKNKDAKQQRRLAPCTADKQGKLGCCDFKFAL